MLAIKIILVVYVTLEIFYNVIRANIFSLYQLESKFRVFTIDIASGKFWENTKNHKMYQQFGFIIILITIYMVLSLQDISNIYYKWSVFITRV